ncbi:MAG: hypothetical protein JWR07_920 [Nevskia sp.]|nr:hypothetical protein [Nevskia sp.]
MSRDPSVPVRGGDVRRVFGMPLLLALLSLLGLVSALLGDGAWDALSWLALGIPVAVALRCSFK